ncbi:MAG: hypothetical protein FWD69_02500 [Polyangiaceae bacterium]|nr:hypothetical protein [Polyangiaceae bacterium]
MAKTKRFKSVVELTQLALRGVIGSSPVAGGGPRDSLPVPVRRQGQPLIAFMFYFYAFTPDIAWVSPPGEVAWLDPVSGKLIAKTTVTPAYFGQTRSPDAGPMEWKFSMPSGMTVDSFDKLRNRLPVLYDVLFEAWATSPSIRSSALHDAAREFLKAFDVVSEPPLLPYYNALGREYFEWVRALAR